MRFHFSGLSLILSLVFLILISCVTQNTHQSKRYLGDFRHYAGIAEFFDCQKRKSFYLAKEGVYEQLVEEFEALNLKNKEDAYLWAEGYYQEEKQPYGIDPVDVFIVIKVVKLDPQRGCQKSGRVGL